MLVCLLFLIMICAAQRISTQPVHLSLSYGGLVQLYSKDSDHTAM